MAPTGGGPLKPTPAVIYVRATGGETPRSIRRTVRCCRAYARKWHLQVVDVVQENDGGDHGPYRDGLQMVYHLLRLGRAEAVITADRAMLGDAATYERIAEIVEGLACRGFITFAGHGEHARHAAQRPASCYTWFWWSLSGFGMALVAMLVYIATRA